MDAATRAQIEAQLNDGRCDRCEWTLAQSVNEGCVPGNCSMRPLPPRPTMAVPRDFLRSLLAAAQEAEQERAKRIAADESIVSLRESLDRRLERAMVAEAEVARLTQREVELLAVLRVAKDALDSVGVTLRELALRREV